MNLIIYVNSSELCYKNDSGEEILIDLKNCNENWMNYKKRINFENQKSENIVGQRDICAEPCFIELFTKPFTRIKFEGQEDKKKLRYWSEELQKAGWTTVDLS